MSHNDFTTTKSYPVSGVPNEADARELLQELSKIPGVREISFDAEDRLVQITFDEEKTDDQKIRSVLDLHGHTIINPDRPLELDEDLANR